VSGESALGQARPLWSLEGPQRACYKRLSVSGQVRKLLPSEVRKASHLLARAFAADPFIAYLLPDARRRGLMFPPFFRTLMHHQVGLGTVWAWEEDGRLIGVAAWFPPDLSPASRSVRVRSAANAAMVRVLFPRASGRLFGAFAGFGELHPDAPHWYLAFIGLEPDAQGRGIGHRLLEPALACADAGGTLCYLETPFMQTHAFYRKNGFEITRELHPIPGAPPVWTMTRPPQLARPTEKSAAGYQ